MPLPSLICGCCWMWNAQHIVEEMFFSGTPLLEAVGLHEPFVMELRATIKNAISKALIPMRAYAEQYESFLPILNLDPATYVRLFAAFAASTLQARFRCVDFMQTCYTQKTICLLRLERLFDVFWTACRPCRVESSYWNGMWTRHTARLVFIELMQWRLGLTFSVVWHRLLNGIQGGPIKSNSLLNYN